MRKKTIDTIPVLSEQMKTILTSFSKSRSLPTIPRLQELGQKTPDKLPLPGQEAKIEFEYIRHGTTSLIRFFQVASGTLYSSYLNETRSEADFCEAVRRVVEAEPDKGWVFVCDGLNTHKSESLVKYVASMC